MEWGHDWWLWAREGQHLKFIQSSKMNMLIWSFPAGLSVARLNKMIKNGQKEFYYCYWWTIVIHIVMLLSPRPSNALIVNQYHQHWLITTELWCGDSPISTGILDHNVVVFVDPADGTGGGERLKHAICPASMTVLQGLHNLQVQVDVYQVSNLQATWIPAAILLTWSERTS